MVGVGSSKSRVREENNGENGEWRGRLIFLWRLSPYGELLRDMRGGCPILGGREGQMNVNGSWNGLSVKWEMCFERRDDDGSSVLGFY